MSREDEQNETTPPRKRPEELSFSAMLRRQYGGEVDPGILLEAQETPSSPSGERLEKLAARSPESSRYLVKREVARGGMGAILEVWDEDLRRNMAMKVVLGRDDDPTEGSAPPVEPEKLSRFLEEAQITGQLDHPGIVPVHDLGIDPNGRVFFTMPLIKGRELKEIFEAVGQEGGNWTQTRVLGVFVKICEAMAFAHSKGVVHRDLKPTNVMVGRFGEAYVMDWGLAKVLGREDSRDLRPRAQTGASSISLVHTDRRDELESDPESPVITMDGDVVGTPAYMSPEQAGGRRQLVDQRSDVYCVGAMLYHMLGRQMPYVAPGEKVSPYTVLNAVRQGPPTPLTKLDKSLPAELVAITEKAMATEREERYPSMRELAEDLRAFLEGRVVAAYDSGRMARFQKWVGRNRGLAAALSLALLLAFGSLFTILGRETMARREAETREAKLALLNDELSAANTMAQESLALAEQARRDAVTEQRRADDQADRAQRGELNARRNSYVANISVANYSLKLNDTHEAVARLALCDADLRGWEWHHLRLKADTSIWAAPHPGKGPRIVGFSAGGDHVRAVVGLTATTLLAESGAAADGEGWRSSTRLVSSIALSPSRERVAVGGGMPTPGLTGTAIQIEVHQAATGLVLAGLSGHDALLSALALSPDDRFLASGDASGKIMLWDLEAEAASVPQEISVDRYLGVTAITFGPTSEQLIAGFGDGLVRGWNLADSVELDPIHAHEGRVTAIAIDTLGSRAVTASIDRTAKIWDLGSGREPQLLLGHADVLTAVAFSPDGQRVATASADRTARVWDAATGLLLTTLRGHTAEVSSIDFHPDGDLLVTTSKDETVRMWDIEWSDAVLNLEGHDQRVNDAAFSPDGERLYTVSFDRSLIEWDLSTGEPLYAHREPSNWLAALAVSADGRLFAASGREDVVRVWRADNHALQAEIRVPDAPVQALAFDPSGRLLASGGDGEQIELWDPWTGKHEAVLKGHSRTVTGLAFSDDGARLGSVSRDKTLRIWDIGLREEVFRARLEKGLNAVAFSPAGTIATAGQDGIVSLFDGLSEEPLHTLIGHEGWVNDVTFSRDGRRLVTGGADGTVRVWNALSGGELISLQVETKSPSGDADDPLGPRTIASVRCVAMGPRGQRVAAGTAAVSLSAKRGEVHVFESGPAAARTRQRRQNTGLRALAEPLLRSLFGELSFSPIVIEALRTDTDLPDDLREAAIRMARVGSSEFTDMDVQAWEILAAKDKSPELLAGVFVSAKTAYDADPDDPAVALLYAAAQQRVGNHASAKEILDPLRIQLAAARAPEDSMLVVLLLSALTEDALGNGEMGLMHMRAAMSRYARVQRKGLEQPWMRDLLEETVMALGVDLDEALSWRSTAPEGESVEPPEDAPSAGESSGASDIEAKVQPSPEDPFEEPSRDEGSGS